MVKFLPSYVGSKAYWIKHLNFLKGKDIAELFCGSAVISANLARTSYLNDENPMIYKILSEYDSLVEMKTFTKEDYFNVRGNEDWWRYVYYLQGMSFSGVFRYSKNGFNVPVKPLEQIEVLDELIKAKKRMKELNPTVMNESYINIDIDDYKDHVVILDPPYEGSQASYNGSFNYAEYWDFVDKMKKSIDIIVLFDRKENLIRHFPCHDIQYRSMRVNGKKNGDIEGMVVLDLKQKLKIPFMERIF